MSERLGGDESDAETPGKRQRRIDEKEAERFRKMQGKLEQPEVRKFSIEEFLGRVAGKSGSTSEEETVE